MILSGLRILVCTMYDNVQSATDYERSLSAWDNGELYSLVAFIQKHLIPNRKESTC